jgi:hypothetical protein
MSSRDRQQGIEVGPGVLLHRAAGIEQRFHDGVPSSALAFSRMAVSCAMLSMLVRRQIHAPALQHAQAQGRHAGQAERVVAQVEAGGHAQLEAAPVFLHVVHEGLGETRQAASWYSPALMAMLFSVYITSVMWMSCGTAHRAVVAGHAIPGRVAASAPPRAHRRGSARTAGAACAPSPARRTGTAAGTALDAKVEPVVARRGGHDLGEKAGPARMGFEAGAAVTINSSGKRNCKSPEQFAAASGVVMAGGGNL